MAVLRRQVILLTVKRPQPAMHQGPRPPGPVTLECRLEYPGGGYRYDSQVPPCVQPILSRRRGIGYEGGKKTPPPASPSHI